ncbi:unnamed protein product [Owenia fusiformis]|uniref:Uncharacterized protein n=1 Tax=Owenia fusiformis TaxID=6347 RepID=A0A8J1UV73_OWEFU|nr:unnamed protein product [Owenia fusiformis]
MKFFLLFGCIGCIIGVVLAQADFDPCLEGNYRLLDEPDRSTGYDSTGLSKRCDRTLQKGWYMFVSGAGSYVPESCPKESHCGTTNPIWMDGPHPPRDGFIYPRTAYASVAGICNAVPIDMEVKMCNEGPVYHLQPTKTCDMAYCAGSEVECPAGTGSPTGFTPCDKDIPPRPKKPSLTMDVVNDKIEFRCYLDDNTQSNKIHRVEWFTNRQKIYYQDIQYGYEYATLTENQLRFNGETPMGKILYCKVRARYTHKSIYGAKASSPGYYMGIKITGIDEERKEVDVSEDAQTQYLELTSTIPIVCNSLYFSMLSDKEQRKQCKVTVTVENSNDANDNGRNKLKCPDGRVIEQIKFGTCGATFTPDNWQITQRIAIKATRDFMYDGVRVKFIDFSPIKSLVQEIWNGYQLPSFQVKAEDFQDKKAMCKSQNDPHMTTFDGHYYHNFYEGEFVLYRNTNPDFPFEVHAFYKRCNNFATCNCAIAARAGDDVIIVDRCNTINGVSVWGTNDVKDYNYLRTKVATNWDEIITPGFKIFRKSNGNTYEIHFPHGAYVRIQLAHGNKYGQFLNAYVYPSPDDIDNTIGLCGIYNKNKTDDLTLRNGRVYTGKGSNHGGQPKPFSVEWRVREDESLYNGRAPNQPPYQQYEYCDCIKIKGAADQLQCNMNSDVERCQIVGTDITSQKLTEHLFKKTQPSDKDDDDDAAFTFDEDFEGDMPEWPTPGGWTEEEARKFCEDFLLQSSAFQQCVNANVTDDLEEQDDIDTCMTDILLADNTDWANAALEGFKEKCENEAKKAADTFIDNRPAVELCLNDCSGKGKCEQGECDCNNGWTGADCSQDANLPPTALFIPREGKCDIRSRPCKDVVIYGDGFLQKSNLKCRIQRVKIEDGSFEAVGSPLTVQADFESFAEVSCPFETARRKKRSSDNSTDSASEGYTLSVSNDGSTFSNPMLYVRYDGRCQNCTANGACYMQPGSCMIQGYCFATNDMNPDNECQICDPSNTDSSWSRSPTCPQAQTDSLPSWAGPIMGAMAVLVIVLGVGAAFLYIKINKKKSKVDTFKDQE